MTGKPSARYKRRAFNKTWLANGNRERSSTGIPENHADAHTRDSAGISVVQAGTSNLKVNTPGISHHVGTRKLCCCLWSGWLTLDHRGTYSRYPGHRRGNSRNSIRIGPTSHAHVLHHGLPTGSLVHLKSRAHCKQTLENILRSIPVSTPSSPWGCA